MLPPLLFLPLPAGKRPPLVLPRELRDVVSIDDAGWPAALIIPPSAGLLDPSCGYWHGAAAANSDCGRFAP